MSVCYTGQIIEIKPIDGADFIDSATVICGPGGKWRGTVKKGERNNGDLVTVFLQDALLPQTEEYAFMSKYAYRVRMAKFKGVPSECLIMPYKIGTVGDDIASILGIEKYEKPIPAGITGDIYGAFPYFIPKTDEPNYQTVPEMCEALLEEDCYVTEKADGSSVTFYKYDGHFGVCSRNWELKDTPTSAMWKLAHKYHLPEILKDNMVVQAEIVGPGIQKNPMKLPDLDIRVFNLIDLEMPTLYKNFIELVNFCEYNSIPMVRVLYADEFGPEVFAMAEGNYPSGSKREGVVIRPTIEKIVGGKRLSFKVINLEYKE